MDLYISHYNTNRNAAWKIMGNLWTTQEQQIILHPQLWQMDMAVNFNSAPISIS